MLSVLTYISEIGTAIVAYCKANIHCTGLKNAYGITCITLNSTDERIIKATLFFTNFLKKPLKNPSSTAGPIMMANMIKNYNGIPLTFV